MDRAGNRQLDCALHRIPVTQGRIHSLPHDGASASYARLFVLRTGDTVDFAVGPNLPYSGHIGLEAVISGGLAQE